jgi:hypothetical protein
VESVKSKRKFNVEIFDVSLHTKVTLMYDSVCCHKETFDKHWVNCMQLSLKLGFSVLLQVSVFMERDHTSLDSWRGM